MASHSERTRMRNRGLLTKGDRQALRGEREVDDDRIPDIRYNVSQRMERIERDLEILRASGHGDLVAEFYDKFSRAAQLEERVAELEARLED